MGAILKTSREREEGALTKDLGRFVKAVGGYYR
jgi:hypothetical protein